MAFADVAQRLARDVPDVDVDALCRPVLLPDGTVDIDSLFAAHLVARAFLDCSDCGRGPDCEDAASLWSTIP